MMKKAAIIILTALACVQLSAQTSHYTITKGDKHYSDVTWTVITEGNTKTFDIVTGDIQRSIVTCDPKGKTSKLHFITNDGKNDYTVTLKNGVYTLKGTLNGKVVDKTTKSDGYPWYQLISYSSGLLLNAEHNNFTYECIRPGNGKVMSMTVSIEGQTRILGHDCNKIKCTTTGVLSGVWSCRYYSDIKTGQYIKYEGVEGVPGTPMTTWMLQD